MAKWNMSDEEFERQYAEAKKRGEERMKTEPRAQAARFDPAAKQLVIELHNGCVCSCPADLLPGLRGASAADLTDFELMPGGFDLHWKRLDVQYTVAGLLNEFFSAKPDTTRRVWPTGAATKRKSPGAKAEKTQRAGVEPAGVRPVRKAV